MKEKIFSSLVILGILISPLTMMVTVMGDYSNEEVNETIENYEVFLDIGYLESSKNSYGDRIDWSRWLEIFYDLPRPLEGYTPSPPIRINEDDDFEIQGWPGDGTEGDPYVIQGYEIDGEGMGNCIFIGNTTVHFELRDNYVYNASGNSGEFFRNSGINLHEVTNGTIVGNIVYNNPDGIYMMHSSDNELRDNVVYGSIRGINIRDSSEFNLILNNDVSDCTSFGVFLTNSDNNEFRDNTIVNTNYGMEIRDSDYCTIYNNTVKDHTYAVFFRRANHNSMFNNLVESNAYGINVERADHNIFDKNTITQNNFGMQFDVSRNNIIVNNTFSYNSNRGIHLRNSYEHPNPQTEYNMINNNTISDNNLGISLTQSRTRYNTVSNNTIYNNTESGILINSNVVVWNNYISNTISDNGFGIENHGADQVFTGNNIYGNHGHGIYGSLRSSTIEHNDIFDNTGNGILVGGYWNTISNNVISNNTGHGIFLDSVRWCHLLNNAMMNNGIFMSGDLEDDWNSHTIDTNNTVNGGPVYYIKSQENLTVPSGAGQVIVVSSTDVTVEHQEFLGGSTAVLTGYSNEVTISNCSMVGLSHDAIYLHRSNDCTVVGSEIHQSEKVGILLERSDRAIVQGSKMNGSGDHGIHIERSTDGMIRDNLIEMGYSVGMYVHSSSTDNVVLNNTIRYNDGIGVYIDGSSGNIPSNNHFLNNTVRDNGGVGFYLLRADENTYDGNTVINNTQRGFFLQGSNNNIFSNNTIAEHSGYNIQLDIINIGGSLYYSRYNSFDNNVIHGNGIQLFRRSHYNIIQGNTIIDFFDRGVYVRTHSPYTTLETEIVDNHIISHQDAENAYGIHVESNCNDNIIHNNTVEKAARGILASATNNIISNNTLMECNVGIYTLGSDNEIVWNTIENSVEESIYTSSDNNLISNNTIFNSGGYSIYIIGTANTVFANTIDNSSSHGIYVASSNNMIKENIISDPQGNGIEIQSSSNVDIYNNTILQASQHAIHLSSSFSCVLKGNEMHGSGIMISGGWDASNWNSHSMDENNTVNGLPLIYRTGVTGGNVSGNVGQVIIADCSDMMLTDLTIENGGVAVLLGFSDNNIIFNSTLVNNSYGVYLHSSNGNLIYHNNFINNSVQAHDDGNNVWDSGYPSGGNHWSDWTGPDEYSGPDQDEPGSDGIVDEPRSIAGGDNQDDYPWTVPSGWDITAPVVVITGPTSGDVFEVGAFRNITWNTVPGDGEIIGVDLDYSIDGGDTWINIVEGTDDTGTYPWLVPDDVTTSARIRISVHDDNGLSAIDVSDQFSILVIQLNIVSTDGGDVTVPGEGSFSYGYGEVVDLFATNQTSYQFMRWEGDVDTVADIYSSSTNVTMEGNYSITAVFEMISHDLTVDSTDGGSVIVPGEDTFTYEYGTVVDIVAVPDTGYHFVEWSGDVDAIADPDSNETTITIHGDYSITAVFAIDTHSLTVDSTDGGTVTVPGEDTFTYDYDMVVDLVAVPDTGYHFVEWSGDVDTIADPDSNETTITIHGDYSITAVFAINTYGLTVDFQGEGSVDISPDLPVYEHGAEVTLSVTPDYGWEFSHWTGDHPEGKESDETIAITMDDDKSLTAHFVVIQDPVPPSIEITSPDDGETFGTDIVTIYWKSQEGTYPIDHHEIKLNDGDWIDVGSDTQYTFVDLEDGTYTVIVRVVDGEGLSEEDSISFSIDIPDDPEFLPVNASLIIDPEVGYAPLTVSITIGAENIGELSGTLELLKDGTVIQTLEIPAQDTAEHTFTHTFSDVGEYELEFHDQTSIVVVEEQIGFEPVNLTLDVQPTEGTVPLEVTITVTGENIGEEEGSITVSIDGTSIGSLTIPAGETADTSFTHLFEDPGTYSISFYDLSQEVVVGEDEEVPPDDEDPNDKEPEDKGMSTGLYVLIGVIMIILLSLIILWMKKGKQEADSLDEDTFEEETDAEDGGDIYSDLIDEGKEIE